jgi:hypothetical protein
MLMKRTYSLAAVFAFALASLTISACSDDSPSAPTQTPGGASSGVGESTLKATAPTPLTPINDVTISGMRPTLQVASASGQFVNQNFAYNFEVMNASGALVNHTTLPGTSWAFPEDLATNAQYRWRARAMLDGVGGPWSATHTFRTQSLPGCINGRLEDPKAYFFHLIGRKEGDSARDWEFVLRSSGLPAGPVAGQRIAGNAPFYGLTQQINSSGGLRGRVFLPTDTPSIHGYFIQDVDVLSDPSATFWVWRPFATPAYSPRACP